jgi:LacI family transcriptional regulator
MSVKINIKTISSITGFSQATISNVLNNKKGVSQGTAETILRVAREIGYLDSQNLSSVKVVMYKKSGKILTDSPFISTVLEGIETECHVHGLDTIIYHILEKEDNFQSKLDQIIKERSSGIILVATELSWPDMRPFQDIAVPLVVLDAWFREGHFDTVFMDNTSSLYYSVRCLFEHGHSRIGFINSTVPVLNFSFRKKGFIEAMAEFGLAVEDRFCINVDPTLNGAYEDMLQYLTDKSELPSAFCVVNDVIAFGVMKALLEYGYYLPDDISIIGFDNVPYCEVSSPPLTTIDVPKKELGQVAVKRLLALSGDAKEARVKTELLTKLILRKSVKKIKKRGNHSAGVKLKNHQILSNLEEI